MNMRSIAIAALSAIAVAMVAIFGGLYSGQVEAARDGQIVVASLAQNPAPTQPPYCKWTKSPANTLAAGPACKGQGPLRLSGTPCPVGSKTICSGVTPTCCYSSKSSIFYCASRCS